MELTISNINPQIKYMDSLDENQQNYFFKAACHQGLHDLLIKGIYMRNGLSVYLQIIEYVDNIFKMCPETNAPTILYYGLSNTNDINSVFATYRTVYSTLEQVPSCKKNLKILKICVPSGSKFVPSEFKNDSTNHPVKFILDRTHQCIVGNTTKMKINGKTHSIIDIYYIPNFKKIKLNYTQHNLSLEKIWHVIDTMVYELEQPNLLNDFPEHKQHVEKYLNMP